MKSNVRLCLVDRDGRVLPGSERVGHNVFTMAGREHFSRLVAWSSLGNPDSFFEDQRIRGIVLGSGTQPESLYVSSLVSPVTTNLAGRYLKTISFSRSPMMGWMQYIATYASSEVSHSGPVVLSEAALVVAKRESSVLTVDAFSATQVPAFYITFEDLVKTDDFEMQITWDLKFI